MVRDGYRHTSNRCKGRILSSFSGAPVTPDQGFGARNYTANASERTRNRASWRDSQMTSLRMTPSRRRPIGGWLERAGPGAR